MCEKTLPGGSEGCAGEESRELASACDGVRTVFPGVSVAVTTYRTEQVRCVHQARAEMLEINYCREGRAGWEMQNGTVAYLGPGDFSLHTRALCAGSVMTLPGGFYRGLSLCIDCGRFDGALPELLRGTGISAERLREKYCGGGQAAVLRGNEETEAIFRGFFREESRWQSAYDGLRTIELLLRLAALEAVPE